MRRAAMPGLFVLLAVAMVFAQAPAGSSAQPGQTPNTLTAPNSTQNTSTASSAAGIERVDAGTEIRAALDTPLSTRTSKPGDRFTTTITDSVRANNGAVVIPSGARIEGEVAEAEEGKTVAALRGKSTLSLRFRSIVMPNGQTLPFIATLVSVHDTSGKNMRRAEQEGQMQSGTHDKDIGIGAGIGTGTGLVFGGPLKGLAIGALAGGGYVLSTKGKDVNLPARTGMVIRLDQPLSALGTSAPQ